MNSKRFYIFLFALTAIFAVANTVKYAEPIVHVTKNLREISLFNIVIEYKIHL